ncbi:MAG: TetR family transcriptional regulator [Alphaproteobacteria bacterium]|nr:TetR family transcriptional regulator [Alphaproteobacteria bacterium]
MPVTPARKARTRQEILDHAARLFRLRGYEATTIDDVMLAAGLTRGAFYAHFASKDALFAEVVRTSHGLLRLLRNRTAGDAEGLRQEAARVLDDYLHKDHLGEVAVGCTLAALPSDVGRAPLAARLAYATALHGLIGELGRGTAGSRRLDEKATAAAVLCVGAIGLARACGERRLGDWLLRCARRAAAGLLEPARRRASPAKKRSRSRRKASGGRRSRRVGRSRGGRAASGPKARSSAARR